MFAQTHLETSNLDEYLFSTKTMVGPYKYYPNIYEIIKYIKYMFRDIKHAVTIAKSLLNTGQCIQLIVYPGLGR